MYTYRGYFELAKNLEIRTLEARKSLEEEGRKGDQWRRRDFSSLEDGAAITGRRSISRGGDFQPLAVTRKLWPRRRHKG